MSIESIGPYSPDIVYGELTSPFLRKRVQINSHTPYDDSSKVLRNEPTEFSRAYFRGKNRPTNIYGHVRAVHNDGLPKISKDSHDIKEFDSSELNSNSAQLIKNSIKQGYTTEEALVINQAQYAYNKSATLTNNPVGTLSTCEYEIY